MISIDENARKRFESDWLKGQSLSIKDYLPSDGNETYIGTLEELVCIDLEFRWKQSANSQADADATVSMNEAVLPTRVEDYLREFPELNSEEILTRLIEQEIFVRVNAGFVVEPNEYRSRFPEISVDESLFSSSENDATRVGVETAGSVVQFPQQFGNYILTNLLGQGGMGAVYRARQPAAGREVAIKIADVTNMSPGQRSQICTRFETEAHAAASLQHDNVVPIYDVGNVDGQPFYAMRLVEGGDLGSMSKANPLAPKEAAAFIQGVSSGLHEAHQRGMLHRDVKPQNILVDGSTGRALITDFGLARFTADDSGLTQMGQLLGTPSFMPPEQIHDSSAIDARADVYSLGATLYQLLTGSPPFKSSDMHATLKQVLNDEPVAPRRLVPSLDRDLETICLRCLEKEPSARFQSAGELADELQRFMDGRPIVSRPAGPVRRCIKWSKRNPTLATALSVAALALVATFVSITWGLVTTTRQRNLNVAVSNVARGGIDELYIQLSDEPLLRMPGIEPLRKGILFQVLDYYEQLVAVSADEQSLVPDRAFALSAIGNVLLELDEDPQRVRKNLEDSLAMIAQLKPSQRQTESIFEAKSNAEVALGVLERKAGDLKSALEYFEASTATRRSWSERHSESQTAQRKLANSLMNEGIILAALNELPKAEDRQITAQELRIDLKQNGYQSKDLERNMAQAEFNLAFLALKNGDPIETLRRLNRSSEQFGRLANEAAVDGNLWKQYIRARMWVADFTIEARTPEAFQESTELLQQALSDVRVLLSLSCQRNDYCLSLVSLHQQGIDKLINQHRFVADNNAQIEFAALARDEWNELEGYLKELALANNAEDLLINDMYRTIELQAILQDAKLSTLLDSYEVALEKVERAIEFFANNPDIVDSSAPLQQEKLLLEQLRDGGLRFLKDQEAQADAMP